MSRAPLLLLLATAVACSSSASPSEETPTPAPRPTTAPTSTSTASKDAGPAPGTHPSAALQKCAESKGDINSIADTVARLNALVAKGGDAACLVATLPRPLEVVATLNTSSAQPAGGRGAPRIFLMLPKIVIGAVPEGEGSKTLELGQWTGSRDTIKAEIGVPVTATLAADAPFTRILKGADQTVCATCHGKEERHPTIANAFVSSALKPTSASEVTVEDLEQLHTLCTNAGLDSPRCNFFHALFDFGEVKQGAFSPVVPTQN